MTRHEWIRQAAGVTAVAAMPKLLADYAPASAFFAMRNCVDKADSR